MKTFLIPAERWERFSKADSSCQALSQKNKQPIAVRTFEHEGRIFTSFRVSPKWYGETEKPCIEAWRLLPVSHYHGETTTLYHGNAAIAIGPHLPGRHQSRDLNGLIVLVSGEPMVCVEREKFLMTLPTTPPLSQDEAVTHGANSKRWCSAWLKISFKGKIAQWFSLKGHPVALFCNESTAEGNCAVLFWKEETHIRELFIRDDVRLDAAWPVEREKTKFFSTRQMKLF